MSISNESRNGNFTSSTIVALTSLGSRTMTEQELAEYKANNPKGRKTTIEAWPGEKAQTYIAEKNMERRMGRSLSVDVDARATTWGNFLEPIGFEILGDGYNIHHKTTFSHPVYPFWKGSPDVVKEDEGRTIGEMKCPYTPKSFCQLVQPLYDGLEGMEAINAIRNGYTDKKGLFNKPNPDAEKYYWQIISNACIKDCKYGELIIFMPYKSQLEELRHRADGEPDYYRIWASQDNELPYLPDGGYYRNINICRFYIPEADKQLLEKYVKAAGELLETI